MRFLPRERSRWLTVATFAVGMAWLEAATVYYLRAMVDRIEPYQPNPLPIRGVLGEVELVREAATLLMLLTIGMLAGRTWRKRWGYTAIAFGVWDILYYVFLRIICGWPRSLLDWDILFLLPLPWWGPVVAPVSIALLMIAWGTATTQVADRSRTSSPPWIVWGSGAIGIVAGALRLHGRCSSHDRPGSGRHQAGAPDIVRLDVVLRCPRADGCAGRTVRMANAVTRAGAVFLTGSNA